MDIDALYKIYVAQGLTPKDAAKRAQEETGMSTVTGKPIKQKKVKFNTKGVQYGEYPTLETRK